MNTPLQDAGLHTEASLLLALPLSTISAQWTNVPQRRLPDFQCLPLLNQRQIDEMAFHVSLGGQEAHSITATQYSTSMTSRAQDTSMISNSTESETDGGAVNLQETQAWKLQRHAINALFTPFASSDLHRNDRTDISPLQRLAECASIQHTPLHSYLELYGGAHPHAGPLGYQAFPSVIQPQTGAPVLPISTTNARASDRQTTQVVEVTVEAKQKIDATDNPKKRSRADRIPPGYSAPLSQQERLFFPSRGELDALVTNRQKMALKSWYERLNELVHFKQEHKHCRVPQRYNLNQRLANWVNKQRCNMVHTKAQLAALESVGFEWAKGRDKHWTEMYQKLVAFRTQRGHCDVPTKGSVLGHWVSKQRESYRNISSGTKPFMSKERYNKLAGIGFIWTNNGSDTLVGFGAPYTFNTSVNEQHKDVSDASLKWQGEVVPKAPAKLSRKHRFRVFANRHRVHECDQPAHGQSKDESHLPSTMKRPSKGESGAPAKLRRKVKSAAKRQRENESKESATTQSQGEYVAPTKRLRKVGSVATINRKGEVDSDAPATAKRHRKVGSNKSMKQRRNDESNTSPKRQRKVESEESVKKQRQDESDVSSKGQHRWIS